MLGCGWLGGPVVVPTPVPSHGFVRVLCACLQANGSYENAFAPMPVPRLRGQVKQMYLGGASSAFVTIFGQMFVAGMVYEAGDRTSVSGVNH